MSRQQPEARTFPLSRPRTFNVAALLILLVASTSAAAANTPPDPPPTPVPVNAQPGSSDSELKLGPDHPAVQASRQAKETETPEPGDGPLILGLKVLAGLVVLVIVIVVCLPILSGVVAMIQQARRRPRR